MSRGTQFVGTTQLVVEECCNCFALFAMTVEFKAKRLIDHKSFYCPAGHKQYYTGKSTEEKLQNKLRKTEKRLAAEQECCIQAQEGWRGAERQVSAYKGVVTKMKQGKAP